jgi:hypothetical protein
MNSVGSSARARLGGVIVPALRVATVLTRQRVCVCAGACVCVWVLQHQEIVSCVRQFGHSGCVCYPELSGGCERRVHRSTPPREVGGAHGLCWYQRPCGAVGVHAGCVCGGVCVTRRL